jgi:hypothetical protein
MASTNGVIFPERMVNFLSNPVDICFGSVQATSTAPAACLVIEGNMVTTHLQIETDRIACTSIQKRNEQINLAADLFVVLLNEERSSHDL